MLLFKVPFESNLKSVDVHEVLAIAKLIKNQSLTQIFASGLVFYRLRNYSHQSNPLHEDQQSFKASINIHYEPDREVD